MEVKFAPELENSLNDIAERSGRAPNEIVEEVVAEYVAGLTETRDMLDSRYDDLVSGRVQGINAEEFLEDLMKQTREMIQPSSK
jgi:predicted transcriptional regulator